MNKLSSLVAGMALVVGVAQANAQDAGMEKDMSPTCADIQWSANILEKNPDIGMSCQAVYERNGELYAKATIEVVRVRGNRLTFRPLHTDGTKGKSRSIRVPADWRAEIAGREYRVEELIRGQELNVYIPQDRFALAVVDDDGIDAIDIIIIEEAVMMPTTASPLFLIGAAGAGMLALGGALSLRRRRKC